MPYDKRSSDDHLQTPEGRALRNFSLMAMPWLMFQQEMLSIMKKGIDNANNARPVENLTAAELQAFLMIFDPTGRWRALIDGDLEKTFTETYDKILPKLVSGSHAFIEAQEAILKSVCGLLEEARKNSGTGKKSSDKSSR
jgi:hypothetical protein